MKLEFELIPSLPRLAWVVRLRRDDSSIQVLHGPWVETREDCFFEGSWNGPFESARFDEATMLAGSGGRLKDGGILFATPSHMFERLHSVRVGDQLMVSNSLALLLALSGKQLDPAYPHYALDFLDYYRVGIRVKEKRLRLLGPGFVELHDCCNFMVTPSLIVSRLEKTVDPVPWNFEHYVQLLERTIQSVLVNAAHPTRKRTYRPVTMLSQGYDTTAISVLASKAGCREAVTFRKSHSDSGYIDDSGSAIAACLGLSITEYERMEFENLPSFPSDEFYLDPEGADRSLVLMEEQLTGTLLLTGRGGDPLWTKNGRHRWENPEDLGRPLFQRPNTYVLTGCALGEFRIRTGFLQFPPACAGALHANTLHALTQSAEMNPWSIGGPYDRPIARRIAEEAGVPRHLFGQEKKGGPPQPPPALRTPVQRAAEFTRSVGRWPPLKKALRRAFGNRFDPRWSRGSFAIQQGVDRMVERYRAALTERVDHGV